MKYLIIINKIYIFIYMIKDCIFWYFMSDIIEENYQTFEKIILKLLCEILQLYMNKLNQYFYNFHITKLTKILKF